MMKGSQKEIHMRSPIILHFDFTVKVFVTLFIPYFDFYLHRKTNGNTTRFNACVLAATVSWYVYAYIVFRMSLVYEIPTTFHVYNIL